MPTMGRYCKAYSTASLEQYPEWRSKANLTPPPSDEQANESAADLGYFFLQENLHVTRGIFLDENVVFNDVTPDWRVFCEETLKFAVPPEVMEDAAPAA